MSEAQASDAKTPALDNDHTAALPNLLRLAAEGNEAAFAGVYRIAAPRLYGMALRVIGHRGHAEEVTQEAFMVIWSSCARFDPARGSAMGWMLTIAHRRAVDRVRSAHASSKRDDAWSVREVEMTAVDSTGEAAHASMEAARVRVALGNLSPKHKTAIFLAYFGGQTYTEVAASLGIPQGTAKTRIRDGLRALSVALTAPVPVAT